jgi:hypothetical protein
MKRLMVDSSVPFIATGQIGEAWAAVILEEVARRRVPAATGCLYLLELLDVYAKNGALRLGRRMQRSLRFLCGEVLPARVEDFDLSARLFEEGVDASPRDLLHAAVMRNHGVERVFSVDGPKVGHAGVERVELRALLQELGLKGNYTHERKKR